MKRCKGCVFWERYLSEVVNPVGVRAMNLQMPRRSPHACTLRLREAGDADGAKVKVPSPHPDDQKGPHYGKRVSPWFSCDHHTSKHPPYRTPPPVTFSHEPKRVPEADLKEVLTVDAEFGVA